MAVRLGTQTVTMGSGATTSGTILLRAPESVLVVPSGTLTGGSVSYQVSPDGGTSWSTVRDATGGALVTTVSGTMAWPLPSQLLAASQVRLVSNTAEGAQRTFTVLLAGR